MARWNRHAWRVLDPLLLKMASRIKHLESLSEPDYSSKWRHAASYDSTVRFFEETNLGNLSSPNKLRIGSYSHIRGELSVLSPGGSLIIGHHSYVGPSSRVWAQKSVEIGNYVLISHSVDIHDSNAHSLDAVTRRSDAVNLFEKKVPVDWGKVECQAVRIGDDVWIGFKCSIFKGVTIGEGAVVAAGSVVRKDVPPFTLVAGNPAVTIRELERVSE